jgi:hypothetical protein
VPGCPRSHYEEELAGKPVELSFFALGKAFDLVADLLEPTPAANGGPSPVPVPSPPS